MNNLIIIGASGHGKVILDIAIKTGYHNISFLDDNKKIKNCGGYPVVGKTQEALSATGDKIVAIGNLDIREKIQNKLKNLTTLIHPKSIISRRVKVGEGTVIMAGAIINSDTIIGKGVIINTAVSVDHDCFIGDYSHISVGAHIAGTVNIGKKVWIGAGTIVINNINICDNCIIGAGAVVIKDIEKPGTYVGVPARRIEK